MKKIFSIVTLGCFRNRYDSEVVVNRFLAKGYNLLEPDEISKKNRADILLVNSCGFIDPAKLESIQVIKEAIELKKEKKVKEVYVFGCLVERFGKQLKKHFLQVDKWWGVEPFEKTYQERFIEAKPIDFLKICEGCINKCSYCAIPLIKGPLASRPIPEVLKEVKKIDKSGIKELNIIGQDITSWGKDLGKKENLTDLLKSIIKTIKKIKWIRLIYTHPKHFSNDLIDLIASEEKICNYIDLPIQHINKRILKLMNRKTTPENIIALVKKIRKKIPDCAIRTSVIVGFPTETEAEFRQLLDFIKAMKFDKLGAFAYSQEEGTQAAQLSGHIHHMTKKRRLRQVMEAQQKVAAEKLEQFVGKKITVLVLEKREGFYIGRTQYDAPEVDGVVFIKRNNLKIGRFYKVKVSDSLEYDLVAE
ncbi:MAG: 30S ribosomal protein S12 methylthiotransferase RimO [Candidatus Omnitrophica bacterium]|nr:30S ribosomal protein S12 methylthiotransferase RimO [Candidatus Omnitrophota bacterium]MCF7894095.1 30S ribosomal protein S12 methylthiotransferase RimO [Candidatus Omnitrophota bacterium]